MKRALQGLTAVLINVCAFVAFGGAASADAPSQQGWWWVANAGAVPEVGVNPSPPPPDVPSKGLLVEGGPGSVSGAQDNGPTAFAALIYLLPGGETPGTLTLSVAANSATTPSVTVELCPLNNAGINPEQGGPISDAPTYSCSKNVTAQASASGRTFEFDVSKITSSGNVAVAVLPTSPTDRVVFDQPSSGSLSASPGGNLSGGSAPPPLTSPSPDATPAPTAATGSSGFNVPTSTPAPSNGATAVSNPSAPSPSIAGIPTGVTNTTTVPTTVPAGSGGPTSFLPASIGTDNAKPLAVAVLLVAFVIGAITWLAAGRAASQAILREHQPSHLGADD